MEGAMEAFLQTLCPSRTPGYAWSVRSGSRRLAAGWGGATACGPEPLAAQESTLYDLASLTKPLATSLLALQAFDRGELDLEAPVEGSAPPSFTALQLLRHEAGFPSWLPLYASVGRREEALDWLLGSCPREAPGRRAEYGCPGYILLGLHLERVLHGSLDGLFAERVSRPLALREDEACFAPPETLRARCAATEAPPTREAEMARQHGAEPPGFPEGWEGQGVVNDGNARFLGGVSGNAGLFGTLRAVEVLADAYRPEAGFLSPRSLGLAWTPSPLAFTQRRTAGWKASSSPGWAAGGRLRPSSIGHEGYTGTGLWLEPSPPMSYILLTNRIHPRHPGTDFGPVRAAFLDAAKGLV